MLNVIFNNVKVNTLNIPPGKYVCKDET